MGVNAGAHNGTSERDVARDVEQRWRMVAENAFDGMLLTVPDGRILAANPAACALLGRTEPEVCAAGRAGVVVFDAAAVRFLEERSRSGRARGVVTLRRADGTTFLADVASIVFYAASGETLTSMTLRDVTESERARRALEVLAEAGRTLGSSLDPRQTLEHLTSLIVPRLADVCTVDRLGPDGVTRLALATRDPARRAPFERIRRRAMRVDATAGVDFVLRTGQPSCVFDLTDEWLGQHTLDRAHFEAAKALGVHSFVSVPLGAPDGVTLGALTLMSDGGVPAFRENDVPLVRAIGERAAFAIDNAQRHSEALEARRLRDEVLDVVAHDLRQPLNVIQVSAALVARRTPSRHTDAILRAVQRADALIGDLLLAARAEGRNLPLQRSWIGVADILEEVYLLHAPVAEDKGLELTIDTDRPAHSAHLDRHRLVQMLSNLVGNAIKFTPPGGRVELAANVCDGRVRFVVSDTGSGIAEDDLPHIFDRYWQAAHARHLGAGLGLPISRAIAQAHGGDISVSTAVGVGTTFSVDLPLG